jgi:hypothetical protein
MRSLAFITTATAIISTGLVPAGASAAAPVDSAADLQAYINEYYLDSDIQYSFKDLGGRQIDCIDFYAQASVKQLVARGMFVPTTPPNAPAMPADTPAVNMLSAKNEGGQCSHHSRRIARFRPCRPSSRPDWRSLSIH